MKNRWQTYQENDTNYRAAKQQLERIDAKIEALYAMEPDEVTARKLGEYYVALDAIRPARHWTEV